MVQRELLRARNEEYECPAFVSVVIVVVVVVAVVARFDLTMIVDEGVTGVAAAAEATTALMTMPCAVSGTRAVMAPPFSRCVSFDLLFFFVFAGMVQVMLCCGDGWRERVEGITGIQQGDKGAEKRDIGQYGNAREVLLCFFYLCRFSLLNGPEIMDLESLNLVSSLGVNALEFIRHDIKW